MKKIISFLKKIFYRVGSVFYVGATDMLPEPLTREMEEYYVSLKDNGDSNAKDILIEHNLRLVVFLAKKYDLKFDHVHFFILLLIVRYNFFQISAIFYSSIKSFNFLVFLGCLILTNAFCSCLAIVALEQPNISATSSCVFL